MGDDPDFFTYHRAASSKLKKRFLKKPNIAEASEEFERLKNHLARIECFPYAAFTAISKAKCEQGLMNISGEVDALVDAARYFLKADQEVEDRRCPNFHENLENAIWCFTCAIKISKDHNNNSMAGSLCLEIADIYYKSRQYSLAVQHYKNGIDYFEGIPSQVASTIDKLITCQLYDHDYHGALDSCMNLVKFVKSQGAFHPSGVIPLGFYFDLYKKIEVTRVLLLMLLRTSIKSSNVNYGKVLEDYTFPDEASLATSSHYLDQLLGEELYVYLRSFVLACIQNDLISLRTVQDYLRHMLTCEQSIVLSRIIQELK